MMLEIGMGEIVEEINYHSNVKEENLVDVTLKTIGPVAHPAGLVSTFLLQSKFLDLRRLASGKKGLPVDNLKLILRGKLLHDNEDDDDDMYTRLNDDDLLIVAAKPKPPPVGFDVDDDDEV